MNEKLKKAAPHLLAIVLFLGLSLIYFFPVVSENKDLFQGDLENMSGWGKDLKDYHAKTGDYAFWSNSMFSGMPANYTFAPPIVNTFHYVYVMLASVLPLNHILPLFLYLIGAYILMLSLGCKPWLSMIGAIMYAFASFHIVSIHAGHVNKCLVMATMAPVLGGIILCYRKKYVWGAIVTLLFTGLNVLWSHQQISYYLILTILMLAIVYLVYAYREKQLKAFFVASGILLVTAVVAIAPSFDSLTTTADYGKETMRGGSDLRLNEEGEKASTGLDIDYAFEWSYGKGETMTLLIPNFYGGSSHYNIGENSEIYNLFRQAGQVMQAKEVAKSAPMYWGDQRFTSGPVYVGAIVCFLFVLGLIVVKGKEKWWLLGATAVSFMLAWGANFDTLNNFLFQYLPLYNKFRNPSMALTIAEVTMSTLAILALKEIFDNKGNRKIYLKPVYLSAGITGGLCLIFALFGGALMSFSGSADEQISYPEIIAAFVADRKSLLSSDSWRSFVLIALSAGALWYYINNKMKIPFVLAIIGILVLFDLWTVDKRFLNYDSFVNKKKTATIRPSNADQLILQDADPNYRVLNRSTGGNTFQESATSYFHKSIGGYSPVKLSRYQDIIDYYFKGEPNDNILNMLNTKYIIQSQGGQLQVQHNPMALGNVWFVNELKWMDTPLDEILMLNDIDPSLTAVIDKVWQSQLPNWESLQHEADSTASIRLTNYANPGNLFYESSSSQPRLAVFSEVYYKTWRAYIDGVEAPLVRVNYILRGLEIPAGNHAIEFKCIDEIYLRGAKISLFGSIISGLALLALFGYAIWVAIRKKSTVTVKK